MCASRNAVRPTRNAPSPELKSATSPTTDSAIPASTHQASRVAGQPTIKASSAVVSGLVGMCNQAIFRSADSTASAATTRTAMTGAGTKPMLAAFAASHPP